MIVVFHRTNTRDEADEYRVKHFDPVALVDLPDDQYERTFFLTNTIDGPWWRNDLVWPMFMGAHQSAGCRSTSVGDRVMLSDGRIMEVMPFGWKEVTDEWESVHAIYWNRARWKFYINKEEANA